MIDLYATDGGTYWGYDWDPLKPKEPYDKRKELRYTGPRHLFTVGPSGSGKTKRLILVNLARLLNWSILVVDTKGSLCAMTRAHRKKHGNLVHVLNPHGVLDIPDDGHNPTASLEIDDDLPDNTMNHAEAAIDVDGKEPHFPQGAQDIFSGLEMYTRLEIPGGTLADVYNLMSLPDRQMGEMVFGTNSTPTDEGGWFNYRMSNERKEHLNMLRGNPRLRCATVTGTYEGWYDELNNKLSALGFITTDNRELHSVLSTGKVQLRWLASRAIRRSLSKPPFDFSIMKERPTTVYLILPPRRLGTHRKWLKMVVADCVNALMKDTRRPKVPVLLILDEAYNLFKGGFPVVEDNMPQMREYYLKLHVCFQDLAQCAKLWGENGFETFLANAGVLQAFAPTELTTSEYLSRMTGTHYTQLPTIGRSQQPNPALPRGMSISDSHSISLAQVPWMKPEDIRALEDGYSVIFSHQMRARQVQGSFMPYEHPSTRELLKLDPAA